MDNFFNLRAEKQEHIINAALSVFGKNGYKKTSVADIAEEAGIAKGMINYYFGCKKSLYLFLAELCYKTVTKAVSECYDKSVSDLFDRMKMATRIKVQAMKEHPAILSFLANLYTETDADVADDIQGFLGEGRKFRERWLYDGVDFSKFKPDIDPKLVDKFLVWAGEGFTNNARENMDITAIEEMTKDLYDFLDTMQRHFYK